MRKHSLLLAMAMAAVGAGVLTGCAEPAAEEPPAAEAATPVADAPEQDAAEPDAPGDAAGDANPSATGPRPANQQANNRPSRLPAYKAPFPSRKELFIPPSNARRVAKRSGSDGRFEDSVELMGFVKVDKPHAVLAIDGVVTPVALGEEHSGVQVISIQPPSAVLQRGRSRWTAKLD